MKIQSIHFHDVGPLHDCHISCVDDWTGKVNTQVLLSGPNGCGKSTVLRAVAMLWEAAGYWLDHRQPLPKNHPARIWLQRWGGVAVVLAETGLTGDADLPIGLFFGDQPWAVKPGGLSDGQQAAPSHESLASASFSPNEQASPIHWIGESSETNGNRSTPKRTLRIPDDNWLTAWSGIRKKMILGFETVQTPNLLFMDAEERRWVTPKKRVGEFLAESPPLRWLPRYVATEDWEGQLEASLINLKLTNQEKFDKVLDSLNAFLFDKGIEPDIPEGSNRLRIKLTNGIPGFITLDDLSAGEHQVLIMIYLIARFAEQGCVVMIDEPDLYLHPSLIGLLLARLENMVRELGGQLLLTSHVPAVWERYEITGRRIELGAKPA
jgi:energy-coupling factor transporter ATP-binding protein EcfA2